VLGRKAVLWDFCLFVRQGLIHCPLP
jgi:hypothetical protein